MPDLKLLLLGSPRIEHHDDELKVETRKTIALAAYLAVTGTAQRREHLATLLWPESDQARARASLRYTLSALKRAIGGAYLAADRETITLVGDDDLWIDAERFRSRLAECHTHGHAHTEVCLECVAPLTAAAALYRDDFLTGFTLPDSATFDEWQFFETESLRRDMIDALERLVRVHADAAEYDTATGYARRLVSLDSLHEPAHRALMRLYAQVGRRSAALWQYQECVRILDDELGVEPAAETTRLYEQIQTGVLPATESQRPLFPGTTVPLAQLPAFLESDAAHPAREDDVFVGREPQLAALETHLAAALEGQGRVVFVTGEAGQGKTALLTAFARRAQEKHPDLLVASGAGTAHFGVGDPYLPFCDVLDMLTGDVERPRTVGRLTPEQAQRLWRFAPQAIEAIATVGADLIDVLIPGDVLTQRAAAMAPDADLWVQHVHDRMTRATGRLDAVQQRQLSEQYVRVLDTLAKRQPLLLLLDDLQWADSASVNLLFHLGRRVPGRRLLIVGSYRPSDLTLEDAVAGHASAGTSKHPLQPVVHELTRQFGNIRIDLDELPRREERRFVDALVDSRPNRLDEVFREQLFRRTKGHALFTVELLRELQARGDLVQDVEGRWSAARDLAWDVLPARIEAVIAERIGRLDDDLREMLRTASVEGETFTVQVMAQVLKVDERQVLRQLFQQVAQHHRLVHEGGAVNVGQRRLIQYQFNHSMFKQYLYNSLSPGERRLLHREIAGSLAGLYADRINDITVQLAHHYTQADEAEQAVPYLLQAGDTARNVYAHQEAIDHYRRALSFLKEQQAYDRAARTLMKIGLTYHTAFQFERAREAYEEGFLLWQYAGTRRTADLSPAPHALRIPWAEVATIDPTLVWDSFSAGVIEQLFSGLLAHDPEMGVVPDIARRWDVLDGGRTYVFHLRDDVQWSDGTPVTAGDFEYAWKRKLDPANSSHNAKLFYDIRGARDVHQGKILNRDAVGVQAVDERTLVVELEGPTGYFLQLLAHGSSYAIPRQVVERSGDSWTDVDRIVTCGAFRLDAWHPGTSISLRRNPDYHGQSGGNVERVELSMLSSPSAELVKYEADQLDVVHLKSPTVTDQALQGYPGEYVRAPWLRTMYVEFNVRRPPFDDVRVRRALALAVDTETLANVILKGHALPASGGFVPPGMPGHSSDIGLPYQPEQARRLLAEAGYPDRRRLTAFESIVVTEVAPIGEYLREQWQEVLGIQIAWKELDLMSYYPRWRTQRPHLGLPLGWVADIADPDNFLRVGLFQYDTPWRNAEYERVVQQARRSMEQVKRMELYRHAENILLAEVPIIPLVHPRLELLVKPWVRKFPTSPIKWWFWKDAVIEPH